MADPRQFVGVRLSPAGVGYAKHVAQRDHVTFSEAIRRLLSLGARADKDTHDPQREQPADRSAGSSPGTGHVRPDDSDDRDRHSDRSSDPVPHLHRNAPEAGSGHTERGDPASDAPGSDPGSPDTGSRAPGSIGDALAVLHYAGFAPAPVNDEPRSA